MASRGSILIRQTSMAAFLLPGNRKLILSSKCLLLWHRPGLGMMGRHPDVSGEKPKKICINFFVGVL